MGSPVSLFHHSSTADPERNGGVRSGRPPDPGGRVGRRPGRGRRGGGRLLLPAAAANQAAASAPAGFRHRPHRREGEGRAAIHPPVAGGVRLRLSPVLRSSPLWLQPGRDQVPGKTRGAARRLFPPGGSFHATSRCASRWTACLFRAAALGTAVATWRAASSSTRCASELTTCTPS